MIEEGPITRYRYYISVLILILIILLAAKSLLGAIIKCKPGEIIDCKRAEGIKACMADGSFTECQQKSDFCRLNNNMILCCKAFGKTVPCGKNYVPKVNNYIKIGLSLREIVKEKNETVCVLSGLKKKDFMRDYYIDCFYKNIPSLYWHEGYIYNSSIIDGKITLTDVRLFKSQLSVLDIYKKGLENTTSVFSKTIPVKGY